LNDRTTLASRKVTGAQVLAHMLEQYEVTHFFMVPAILRRTMYEIEQSTSIARVNVHGEKSAVYMADGYARASGRVGSAVPRSSERATSPPACVSRGWPTPRCWPSPAAGTP
jgi:glyoxylate carboligase